MTDESADHRPSPIRRATTWLLGWLVGSFFMLAFLAGLIACAGVFFYHGKPWSIALGLVFLVVFSWLLVANAKAVLSGKTPLDILAQLDEDARVAQRELEADTDVEP